jgi:hypothetical protein
VSYLAKTPGADTGSETLMAEHKATATAMAEPTDHSRWSAIASMASLP